MALQGFSAFSSNAQTYISAQTLKRINRDVIVYGLGKKEKLPNRFSKTFQYTRYEKLNLPYAALSEGVSPTDNSEMSISTVQAVMDQWGSFINLSDVAVITAKHPALQEGIKLLAEQATETIDRECIKLLLSNTNVNYPGTASSRATLISTDYFSTTVAKEAIAALRNAGAHGVSGRLYIGLIDPSVEMDLLEDSTFQNAASYSNIMALHNGEAGTWMGVRWMVSNLIPSMSFLASPSDAGLTSGGTLSNSTSYDYKVVGVSNSLGFEVSATAVETIALGTDDVAFSVTMPATAGFKYNVYAGANGGTLYLDSSLNEPSAVVVVGAIAASGDNPPASVVSGVVAHYAWVLGQEAFAVPELQSLQTYLTPDQASDSDPLAQRRKASWKVMFKPVICNEDFIERIEIASRY